MNDCQNNSTCIPYLENEIHHKYNCTCQAGFHGQLCEKVCCTVLMVIDSVFYNLIIVFFLFWWFIWKEMIENADVVIA